MKKEKEENVWSKEEVQNGVDKEVKFKVEENIWSPEKKNNGEGKYLVSGREEQWRRKRGEIFVLCKRGKTEKEKFD